jgi:hypothetical protein
MGDEVRGHGLDRVMAPYRMLGSSNTAGGRRTSQKYSNRVTRPEPYGTSPRRPTRIRPQQAASPVVHTEEVTWGWSRWAPVRDVVGFAPGRNAGLVDMGWPPHGDVAQPVDRGREGHLLLL